MTVSSDKLVSEIIRAGMEPSNPNVKKEYDDFKFGLMQSALKILKEDIPQKIILLDKEVNQTTVIIDNCKGGIDEMKLKLGIISSDESLDDSKGAISSNTLSAKCRKISNSCTTNSNDQYPYLYNSDVTELCEKIRSFALELLEMVIVVRLWIQLNVPKVEDGNNFGVAIQEVAIHELNRVEDSTFSLGDKLKYHAMRAKLISKIQKYPDIQDYIYAVYELDRKQRLQMRLALLALRTSYTVLYEMLQKNWEKIVRPRNSEQNNYMVM